MHAVRHSSAALIGALLGLAAILSVFALSAWHNAQVTDAHPASVASLAVGEGHTGPADPDAPIHAVAHATAQFLTIAGPPAPLPVMDPIERVWSQIAHPLRDGSDPASPLRPPRG